MIIEDVVKNFISYNEDVAFSNFKHIGKFVSYVGCEDEKKLDWMLYCLNKEIKENTNDLMFINSIANTNDFDLIKKSREIFYQADKLGFRNLSVDLTKDVELSTKIKNALDKLLIIIENDIKNIKESFVVKLLCWIDMYLYNLEKEFSSNKYKCFFYGDIKKHEVYFLDLLIMSGMDVLYINPSDKSNIYKVLDIRLDNISKDNFKEFGFVNVESFDERVKKGETLDKNMVRKTTTATVESMSRIEKDYLKDTGMVFNSWQIQDREIKPVILQTTIDEINIYIDEPLKFRPGYNLKNKTIDAPVFFAKIIGVNEDTKEYTNFVNKIKSSSNTFFTECGDTKNELVNKEFSSNDYGLSYFIKNNKIDKKELINNDKYNISLLETSVQNNIIDGLEQIFESKLLTRKLENSDKVKSLYSVLNLNKKIILLLQNFDYGKVNPKVVLYINCSFDMKIEMIVLLLLFNKLGMDVFIISPVGSKDIERILHEEMINIFRLDNIVEKFELEDNSLKKIDLSEQVSKIGKNVFKFIDKVIKH